MGRNNKDVKLSVKEKKREIIELIEQVKAMMNDFPTVNLNLSLPSFKSDFDVIAFLLDLVGAIVGKKAPELQREVVRFLIEKIEPLERDIKFNIKDGLKSCYACKINPLIAPWLISDGINIPIEQFDFSCFLKINPRSDVGRTLYSGPNDMNYFLYEVIQNNGTPMNWNDPVTGKPIAVFKFVTSAPTKSPTTGNIQTTDFRNNVINMKIHPDYSNKSIIDFINDYLNTIIIFKTETVVSQSMDLLFGVLTRRVKMNVGCVEKQLEFEKITEKLIDCGVDDPNNVIDNSFYKFSNKDIVDIKNRSRNRINGVKRYDGCPLPGTDVDFATISEMVEGISGATDNSTKVEILEKGLSDVGKTSAKSVTNESDKNQSIYAFIEELIRALRITISRLVLSPKIVYLVAMMHYLVVGQINYRGPREWIENIICLFRQFLQKILEELSKFLLKIILRGLKLLLKLYIKYKFEEKLKKDKDVRLSLLGMPESCGGLSNALDNPAAIGYTLVDMGFDQAENQVVKQNNIQKK